jgi:hypothetical protein
MWRLTFLVHVIGEQNAAINVVFDVTDDLVGIGRMQPNA